ncbi:hypothetical protein IVB45_17560 [Bradyrhizobium sp. 4]|uniref:hypothetical protein n=1 Tax=unclassified Bradyrhizobium TaxID=2631580 RepID=UPI001FFB714E|nr:MULTISPECIES: hypothetical protein [unclassified Bradyrhizobium]MCK1402017.1 hypothetical protein [Bradyrhizobium sp. 39]MCK1751263.1 hypothetical protein [Bradyrhizobium sp. 135]UPJ38516.1 hypothetical protein IVB45_17560 [Bradyrhizobium sp. 4]
MANAALLLDNVAETAAIAASSQVLTMPASNLRTPHPSQRWRSLSSADYFVADKGAGIAADTVLICGLTCGANAQLRLRLSSIDATGVAGDILDTGPIGSGTVPAFDVAYGALLWLLPTTATWRFTRLDISDLDAAFVEAGCLVEGVRESLAYNFASGDTIQHVDRSRVSPTSSGMTLTWDDNTFRRLGLSFNAVTTDQRFGLFERLDRVKGRKRNVLLITDPDSSNLTRDSIYGLVTDQTPIAFNNAFAVDGKPLFGKQLRIDERI